MSVGAEGLLVLLLLGAVPAAVIRAKGYPWWLSAFYLLFGGFLFVVALPMALFTKSARPQRGRP